MRIAIFADIHGKILLPFKMVDYYQQVTGSKIDMILQCGDAGVYPYIDRLDKATLKHAMDDRDELGFYDQFVQVNRDLEEYLDRLDIDMVCVRGNHEDHDYLDERESVYSKDAIFPVDCYQRVWMFKSGYMQTFNFSEESLKVIGIGRIGDHKQRKEKRFIQEYERRKIRKLADTVGQADVLITHDKGEASSRGGGLPEIGWVLDNVDVPYHFYGHTGEEYSCIPDENGVTLSVKIKELEFRKEILPDNCMTILEKKDGKIKIKPVPSEITNMFTKSNWKNILF